MNKFSPFAFALFLLPTAHAALPTTIPFSDNETVSLNLSSLDINRLVVDNDKITSVTCPTGFCTMPASPVDGEGTMAPVDPQGAGLISLNVQEPFTLYITTAKGRSFGAFVRPMAVPAVTTVFVSTERDTTQAAEFEKSSPYDQMLAQLIRHMVQNTTPEGFIKHTIQAKDVTTYGSLHLLPIVSYQGETMSGITYTVSNPSATTVTLSPDSFYQKGVQAVSFSSLTLPPNGRIYLYQITGK